MTELISVAPTTPDRGSDRAPLVQTRDLTKRYGKRLAVDGLSMTVRRGEVYGFLGPNGAGKTTTLRMLVGLIRPTSGTASIAGTSPGDRAGLSLVGALIESPAFYPYLSGRDNLRVMARYSGVSPSRVEETLGQVELTGRADDRYRTYSLGMKQRLGVAAALLNDPELLILDEPTNGLDPAGMAEMRDLIRTLGRGDRTVILSSHQLHEVEQIADRVGVIRHGRMVAQGTVDELRGSRGLVVRAEPPGRAREVVAAMLGAEQVRIANGNLEIAVDPPRAAEITRRLVLAGIDVLEVRPIQESLEDVFMHLTGDDGR
jgi:ABC-2 type transport system ATP-binding protein